MPGGRGIVAPLLGKGGTRFYDAELSRLDGKMRILEGEEEAAMRAFERGAITARDRGVPALEILPPQALDEISIV